MLIKGNQILFWGIYQEINQLVFTIIDPFAEEPSEFANIFQHFKHDFH